jgi:hypothetical protein
VGVGRSREFPPFILYGTPISPSPSTTISALSLKMATVMTATFRQRFPPEVLAEIFPQCDPATLATVSRVSSSCLALSSALLYQDITLDDELSLALLLRGRVAAVWGVSISGACKGRGGPVRADGKVDGRLEVCSNGAKDVGSRSSRGAEAIDERSQFCLCSAMRFLRVTYLKG